MARDNLRYVYPFAAAAAAEVAQAGGKGAMLARLFQAGLPVPPGCILTVHALAAYLAAQPQHLPAPAEAASSGWHTGVLPPDMQEELQRLLSDLGPAPCGWAVRSSAVTEDSALASFAGIYESVLEVQEANLWPAIRDCWASWCSARALAYRQQLGDTAGTPMMAVVIQRMVPAQCAGVAFTADPVSGDRTHMVINAAAGLGLAVVSGVVEPEQYILAKKPQVRVVQTRLLRPDYPPLLPATAVTMLGDLLQRLEVLCGSPQDVEWVWDGARCWIVQSRPITTLGQGPAEDEITVWSNANLKDVIPGLVSPLSWSLMQQQLEVAIREQYARVGYTMPSERPLIHRFWGRPYFNISVLQQAGYEFFGAPPETQFEQLGGAALRGFTPAQPPSLRQRLRWQRHNLFILRFLNRIRKQAPTHFAAIERLWQEELRQIPHFDRDTLLHSLATRSERDRPFLVLHLYLTWGMNGHFTYLRQLLKRYLPQARGGLFAELVMGLGEVSSAEHSYRLWELSRLARQSPPVMVFLQSKAWHTWQQALADTPFAAPWHDFLATFGHRGLYEVEVANPRWREQPDYLFEVLAAYAALEQETPPFDPAAQARRRHTAEAEVLRQLTPWHRLWFRSILRQAREFSRLRENSKSHFVRLIDLGRQAALRAADFLRQDGVLDDREAIFLLEVDEIKAALRQELDAHQVRRLVAQRRLERQRYAAVHPPAAFIGERPVYDESRPAGGTLLCGLPSSPGRVTGTARVLRSPYEGERLQPGEILVAPSTDPGWTPLFLLAAGLVMETGGYLSHGAIVAREYGIPAVLNVPLATQRIPDGATIVLDGGAGTVQMTEETP
jgi:phosphohistidine swiveling domain-containing protein